MPGRTELRREHAGGCYRKEQFAEQWRSMVLECTKPGRDPHSQLRVVVTELPDCSSGQAEVFQSTPPPYIAGAVTVP